MKESEGGGTVRRRNSATKKKLPSGLFGVRKENVSPASSEIFTETCAKILVSTGKRVSKVKKQDRRGHKTNCPMHLVIIFVRVEAEMERV